MKITNELRRNTRHARVQCKNRLYRVNLARQVDHSRALRHPRKRPVDSAVRAVTSRKNHAIMRDPNLNTNISHFSDPFIHAIAYLPVENEPLLTVTREIPHYKAKVATLTPRATIEVSSSFSTVFHRHNTLYTLIWLLKRVLTAITLGKTLLVSMFYAL